MKIKPFFIQIFYIILFISFFCSEKMFGMNNELDNNLIFDEKMFRGSNVSQSILTKLTQDNFINPGIYSDTPIIINDYRVGVSDVLVSEIEGKSEICLSESILEQIGFVDEIIDKYKFINNKKSCVILSEISPKSTIKLNSDLYLDIKSPQSTLKDNQSINEHSLNTGENVLFANYTLNYFRNKQTGNNSGDNNYGYLNLNSGFNLGLWQFRQLSSYSYNKSNYKNSSNSSSKWYNIANYVQRPIYNIKSKLTIGKTSTTGQFFGGLSYSGLELSSDERMYPSSEQGYAPVITGIAKTNALVEVRQNDVLIYQTTVPPGSFDIKNINPLSYNGDLNITVIEANGSKSSFVVPFSAVPDSVRPGKIKYSISSGKTRDLVEDKIFFDSNLQYGLNNSITIGGGVRTAEDYKSGLVSTVFATQFGAIGFNAAYSNAHLRNLGTKQGWMTNITYSKSFQPTNTNISLAGYRYSTEGYREFSDFIYENYYSKNNDSNEWRTNSYLQKYRLMASIYQSLGDFGNLSLSASTQEYHSGRSRDLYYQMNYNKIIFDRVNMGLSVSRQKMGLNYKGENSSYDTIAMLSLDIPLGSTGSTLSSSILFDNNNGNQYQSSVSGSLGDQEYPYNYSLNMNYNELGHQTAYAANLSKQYSIASVSVNGSKGEHYNQLGIGATGAFVLHQSGLIVGPYLGDTFGIVEAKGATGAKIYNGQGASIGESGYGLVPSLVPYRYNSIAISSDGMINNNVDIESSEQKIAPYSGVAVKIKFNTNQGYPILIGFKTKNNFTIPIGAIVTDDEDKKIGIVGQNNQAYLRTESDKGLLKVIWGTDANEQCVANYLIYSSMINENLIKTSAECY